MPGSATRRRICILIALAAIAYLPSLALPFIADDYHQIPLARHFAAENWTPLLHNASLRSRATYMFLSAFLDWTFGFNPAVFHLASIILHVLCVLLVYATRAWNEIGESTAFWSAAFFAIQEGHQEAVMWPAAAGDLFVFLFGMAAWLCWIRWLQESKGGTGKWYAGAIASFLAAMVSKESVWAFAALLLLPVLIDHNLLRRALKGAAPFFAIAAVYILWTWTTRIATPAYQDIRFSLSAPWPLTLLNSVWRLLLPWGLIAAAILIWMRHRRGGLAASIWIVVGLLPFCFLTYMHQVPSRLTYTASTGLAWLVGAAASSLQQKGRRAALAVVALSALSINLEIIWVKKQAQLRERAEPSELLKQAAANADGRVSIACSPLPDFVASAVLKSVGTTAVFEHPGIATDDSCFEVDYRDRDGNRIHESRKIGATHHGTFY